MNMAYNAYVDQDLAYDDRSAASYQTREKEHKSQRFTYARSKKAPSSINGIHRRRNKRVSW